MILKNKWSRKSFTSPEPSYHHCLLQSTLAPASDFETEKKSVGLQARYCTNKIFYLPHTHGSQIERYDLIVLHSWTFLAVTLADAKVVKHMESVMLKE